MSRARDIIEAESPRSIIKRLPRLLPPGGEGYYLAIRKPPMMDDDQTEYVPVGIGDDGSVFPQDGEYGLLNDVEDALGFEQTFQRYPNHPDLLDFTDEEEQVIADEMHRYTSKMYPNASKGQRSGRVDGVAGPREWRIVLWPREQTRPKVVEAVNPREFFKRKTEWTGRRIDLPSGGSFWEKKDKVWYDISGEKPIPLGDIYDLMSMMSRLLPKEQFVNIFAPLLPPRPQQEAVSARDLLKKHFVLREVAVIGRRWFRRTYGNTYNTADIYVNGELVHTLPMAGGYGDHYLTRAFDWLRHRGYLPPETREEAPWRLAQKMGFKLDYYAHDVKRERDL